jgi:alkanesulfonate monooxygenase SsuD/methylene tetrahydromethanopterin reductase-like flavin-dependent oxidoreductase (luciferase family)
MLSTWTPFEELARQVGAYRAALEETPPALRGNPGRGQVDIARWCYVADSDARAKSESEAGLLRHLSHFASGHTSGYLGTVQKDSGGRPRDYDALARDVILHGSAATVVEKIERLRDMTGASSIMLHYPPWYGAERTLASLGRFADAVMPKLRKPSPAAAKARS